MELHTALSVFLDHSQQGGLPQISLAYIVIALNTVHGLVESIGPADYIDYSD